MSYILDALRKADAQRERSRAPGLHDQPLGTGGDSPAPAGSMSWAAGGALALGVVAIGLLAWVLAARTPAPAQPPALPGATPSSVAVAPVAAPAPSAPAAVAAPPAAAAVLPPPAAVPASAPAPAATAARPASATAPAVSVRPAEPAAVPPAGAPRVSISGGVWSSEPAQRMLVVNGQVVNEGGELAPGLTLEQVRQGNRAVLVWQGQRFLVGW